MSTILGNNARKSEAGTLSLGALVPWLIFLYALSYGPFISESFVPDSVRIGIEGFVISLLLILTFQCQYNKGIILLSIAFMIFACIVISGTDTAIKVVSSFNKIIFFTLAIGLLCGNKKILNSCIKKWIKLWFFLGVMAILSFVGYTTSVIKFSPLEFGEINPGAQYYYLNNLIFGNLIPRTFFDISFGRVAGCMYEPGLLSFFFGFNILIARSWVNEKQVRIFMWVNFIAGLATLSMTFYFFVVPFFIAKLGFIENKLRGIIIATALFLLCTLFIFYIPDTDFLEHSSVADRLLRLELAIDVIQNNTWITSLLGNGIGIAVERGGMGLSSGPVNVFVERGAIMLIFLFYLLAKCSKHNRWLILYLFYYSFTFEMFWFPVYLLAIAMAYAFSYGRSPDHLKVVMKGTPAFQRLIKAEHMLLRCPELK